MKIKKRLKYKSTLPKADYGMDPNALSKANSDEGGGIGVAGGLNIANGVLNFANAFAPKDNNDGIGISHKGSAISKGVSGGLHAGADIAKAVPGVGTIVGGVMDAAATVTDFITGMVDHVREKDRTKVSRLARKEYDPVNEHVGYSFGNRAVPTSQPVFGGQANNMPLYGNGGEIKYDSNFRPATQVEQKYNEKTGLWEVGGAKPKQTTTTKKTVPQKVTPIYTSDPNDPRLKAYNDSLSSYKAREDYRKALIAENLAYKIQYNNDNNTTYLNHKKALEFAMKKYDDYDKVVSKTGIFPTIKTKISVFSESGKDRYDTFYAIKKPVQPVIYKKEVEVPVPKKNFNTLKEKQDILGDNIQYMNEPETQRSQEVKGKPLNDFLKQEKRNPNGGINTYIRKDINSPWIQQDFELGGDPRAYSDIEAEQGEAMQHSSGVIENIEGKSHENGGTPLQIKSSHEYIYSDSLGEDKNGNITLNEKEVVKSFADKAKSIERKYKGRETDSIVQKTKELELEKLKQDAEQARIAKEEIEMGKQMKKYKAKYGMALKKFDGGGFTFNQNDYIDWIKQTPEYTGSSSVDKINNLNSNEAKAVYRPMYAENIYNKYGADAYNTVVSAFASKPGGFNPGIDNGDKTTYKMPGYSFTTNTQGQGAGIGEVSNTGGGTGYQDSFIGPKMPSSRLPRGGFGPYPQSQIGTPISRAIVQGREAFNPTPKKNGLFSSLTTGDKMQLASMFPAFAFNMGMGLRKADVEPNRKNPYENDVLNMMANRKFDPQHYLNQANLATNTAKEDIGNNSTSVGGKMANLQKLYANQLNTLGDITTKGQEMNNQYRAEEANTKNILGESNRAESIRAAGINDQNKARKQQFLAKAMEQLGQGTATIGQAANQSLTNKLLIKTLSEISPDFDVKNMKDLQVGDDGYIVFKGQKTEFKMNDEGKIVMGGTPSTANAAKSQYAPKDFTMKTFANFTKTKTGK